MGSYYCDSCGHGMQKMKKTSKGMKYKCKGCGKTGYVEGMEESGSPVDESMFGF
jgi:transposase-like protein